MRILMTGASGLTGSMPRAIQRGSDCVMGADYPAPIVDHATARARALAIQRGIPATRREAALR